MRIKIYVDLHQKYMSIYIYIYIYMYIVLSDLHRIVISAVTIEPIMYIYVNLDTLIYTNVYIYEYICV
jgi:hypothetical protein